MALRYAWRRPDGGVTISAAVPGKEERHLEQMMGLGYERLPDIDEVDLPTREYRDAWRADAGGSIYVDEDERLRIEERRAKPTQEERLEALEQKIAAMR